MQPHHGTDLSNVTITNFPALNLALGSAAETTTDQSRQIQQATSNAGPGVLTLLLRHIRLKKEQFKLFLFLWLLICLPPGYHLQVCPKVTSASQRTCMFPLGLLRDILSLQRLHFQQDQVPVGEMLDHPAPLPQCSDHSSTRDQHRMVCTRLWDISGPVGLHRGECRGQQGIPVHQHRCSHSIQHSRVCACKPQRTAHMEHRHRCVHSRNQCGQSQHSACQPTTGSSRPLPSEAAAQLRVQVDNPRNSTDLLLHSGRCHSHSPPHLGVSLGP